MKSATITIPGFTIAYKAWGNPAHPPMIALHGWLDNANSFALLAPFLQEQFYLIAIDLPGHGYSSHLPEGCYYHFSDGIFTILQIINALGYNQFHLLGHSMGACLASLIAGVIPNQVLSMVLLEGLGPFSAPDTTCCEQLTKFSLLLKEHNRPIRPYHSLEQATFARAKRGYLSQELVEILAQRGLEEKDRLFYWRHDRRLLFASPLRMTEVQVLSCLEQIRCQSCLIWALNGFDFDNKIMQNRAATIKNLQIYHLQGGHHIHMEQPDTVAQCLADFYQKP